MGRPFIIYGHRKTSFRMPPSWRLLTFADPGEGSPPEDIRRLVRNALANPVQSAPLRDRLSPADRVAIAVEDVTRSSPKKPILEGLLGELQSVGIPNEQVTILIALGTHRPLTPAELELTFGSELPASYAFINHDCRAPDMVPVGKLGTGATVKVNRRFHEATFRMGVGTISPHPMNGFGGGGKIIFPGVSDFDSIREHHLKWTFHPGTMLGRLEGNVFHEELVRTALAAGLDFILNTVLDQNDKVHHVVAGDPIGAHRVGVGISKALTSQTFGKKSDLTLITSFPYTEGPQIVKPLGPAAMITKEGGCIILAADCTGNLPDAFVKSFARFHERFSGRLQEGVLEHFRNNRLIMEEGAVDFNMALGMTLAIQDQFQVILLSKDISKNQAESMGFRYAGEMEEAFELGTRMCPPDPEVHIVPAGGIVFPRLHTGAPQ